ncbi:hypothetical protein CRG98_026750 [Punica granatum]|uniref:Uncharacterized protein n=1 Tax=Punica granatum TaxID=22663 RepID=A0A2I0J9L3_PUNGR|nr:hypothetical protein CRG98_026750 [Punica granatum]
MWLKLFKHHRWQRAKSSHLGMVVSWKGGRNRMSADSKFRLNSSHSSFTSVERQRFRSLSNKEYTHLLGYRDCARAAGWEGGESVHCIHPDTKIMELTGKLKSAGD